MACTLITALQLAIPVKSRRLCCRQHPLGTKVSKQGRARQGDRLAERTWPCSMAAFEFSVLGKQSHFVSIPAATLLSAFLGCVLSNATFEPSLHRPAIAECPKKHLREVVEVFPGADTEGSAASRHELSRLPDSPWVAEFLRLCILQACWSSQPSSAARTTW